MATAIQPFVDPTVGNKENAPPEVDANHLRARLKEMAAKASSQSQAASSAQQAQSRPPLAPRSDASLAHAQSQQNTSRAATVHAPETAAAAPRPAPKTSSSSPLIIDECVVWKDSYVLSPKEQENRERLVQQLRKHPELPQAWLDLITFDNGVYQKGKSVNPHQKTIPLYVAATMVLPATLKHDVVYGKIWIDYGIALCAKDPEEARSVFKGMERQGIAQDMGIFYLTFASFESRHDKHKQAMAILRQGIERGVADRRQLEEKLTVYAQRDQKATGAPATVAAVTATATAAASVAPIVAVSAPAPAVHVTQAAAAVAAVAPSTASAAPPPTPSVSAASQDPVTPSAGVGGSVNTPASRRRAIRPLGLNTAKLGGATRVKATEVTTVIDEEEDLPSTPATDAPERPMERSASMPARTNPTPAPPPGAAPHPPAPSTGHTERTANSSLAAPSPLSHRSTHHFTTSTGASGYLSSVNNSALSTSSSSSSASSGSGGASPTRSRSRQSVASFPSTPQAPTMSTNNSVALLPEPTTPAPAAVAAPVPTPAAARPAVAAIVSAPAPTVAHAAPAPSVVAAKVPAPAPSVPVATAAAAPLPAPAPTPASRASVAHAAPAPTPAASFPTPSSVATVSAAAAPAGASAAPAPAPAKAPAATPAAPVEEMSMEAWAKKAQEEKKAEERREQERFFMMLAQTMEQIRTQSKNSMPSKPVWVKGKPYLPWEVIGRGGYSVVYRAMGPDMQFYALKVLTPKNDEEAVRSSTENEVSLLEQLRGEPHIIQLIGHEIPQDGKQIALVFELGESDLDQLFKKTATTPIVHGEGDNTPRRAWLPEWAIRFYWTQMLIAVHAIHQHKIIHSDLKPANFVCVRGMLKLIDFGISGKIETNQTSMLRPQFVGTVCYMAPETFVGVQAGPNNWSQKVGKASDVWSLGCILYQMVYGKPPYLDRKFNERVELLKSGRRIPAPPLTNQALWNVMQLCLSPDPKARPKIPELLRCEFLCPKDQGGSN